MEGENIRCTSVQKIIGKAPAETLVQLRTKSQPDRTGRSTYIFFTAFEYRIQFLAIVSRHILYIGHILQTSFYFQGRSTSIQQSFQVLALIHIFQGQQMFATGNRFPVGIYHIKTQATELCTLSPVCTTAKASLADITLSAIAYAQGSVYKHFQRCIRTGCMNLCNFIQRQLTGQHHLTETSLSQEFYFLRSAVVHLRTGMQRNRRKIQTGNPHILHNQGIHPNPVQIPNHFLRFCQFLIFQDCIDSYVNTHPI